VDSRITPEALHLICVWSEDRYYSDYYTSPDPIGRDGTTWTGRHAQELPTDSVGPKDSRGRSHNPNALCDHRCKLGRIGWRVAQETKGPEALRSTENHDQTDIYNPE
jgi:hypothetical protein